MGHTFLLERRCECRFFAKGDEEMFEFSDASSLSVLRRDARHMFYGRSVMVEYSERVNGQNQRRVGREREKLIEGMGK